MMETTWILVADSGRARVFEMHSVDTLNEIQDFSHSTGRFQNRELKTDNEGQFFGKNRQGNTSEPHVSPEKHEADLFADSLNEFLTDNFNSQRYAKLVVIAEPQFLGLLRNSMDDQVRQSVVHELPKDLSKASAQDIRQHINQMGQLSDGSI